MVERSDDGGDRQSTGGSHGKPESLAAERVVSILQIIGRSPRPLSVAEIATELGVHRSIVYRFLRTLVRTGFVRQDDDGGAELGAGLVALARQVSTDVRALVQAPLQDLADRCEATAFITELDGDRTICLTAVAPNSARTHLVFRPGSIGPIDRGAAVMGIYAGGDKAPGEPAEATKARELGYAWSTGQITPGVESVSVPVQLPSGSLPASVSVIYPVGSRVVDEVVSEVRAAARRISALFNEG